MQQFPTCKCNGFHYKSPPPTFSFCPKDLLSMDATALANSALGPSRSLPGSRTSAIRAHLRSGRGWSQKRWRPRLAPVGQHHQDYKTTRRRRRRRRTRRNPHKNRTPFNTTSSIRNPYGACFSRKEMTFSQPCAASRKGTSTLVPVASSSCSHGVMRKKNFQKLWFCDESVDPSVLHSGG